MLMASKFDSYCRKCGRPIFKGDLINYMTENGKSMCVCCYVGFEKESNCPHWALLIHNHSFTSSNKYKYYPEQKNSLFNCLICGKELKKTSINNTTYIQYNTTTIHGRSPNKGYGVTSFIQKGKYNQNNNPDEKSLKALQIVIQDSNNSKDIIDIAFKNIMRINNYNKTLVVEMKDLFHNFENQNDKLIYNWLSKKGNYEISESVLKFLSHSFAVFSEKLEKSDFDLNALNLDTLARFIMVGTLGCFINSFDNSPRFIELSNVLSLILIEFINKNRHDYELLNTVRNLQSNLGATSNFFNLLLRYFMSQSENLKYMINSNLTKMLNNEF